MEEEKANMVDELIATKRDRAESEHHHLILHPNQSTDVDDFSPVPEEGEPFSW